MRIKVRYCEIDQTRHRIFEHPFPRIRYYLSYNLKDLSMNFTLSHLGTRCAPSNVLPISIQSGWWLCPKTTVQGAQTFPVNEGQLVLELVGDPGPQAAYIHSDRSSLVDIGGECHLSHLAYRLVSTNGKILLPRCCQTQDSAT